MFYVSQESGCGLLSKTKPDPENTREETNRYECTLKKNYQRGKMAEIKRQVKLERYLPHMSGKNIMLV